MGASIQSRLPYRTGETWTVQGVSLTGRSREEEVLDPFGVQQDSAVHPYRTPASASPILGKLCGILEEEAGEAWTL